MIIACASCETSFEVDSSQIGPNGRNVRCGNCGHRWRQAPEEDVAATPPSAASDGPVPEQTAAEELPSAPTAAAPAERLIPSLDRAPYEPAPARSRSGLALGLAAAIMLVLLSGAFFFRDAVMRAWPASRAIYAMLNLARGDTHALLEVANLNNEERVSEGRKLIEVSGVVFNPGLEAVELPPLLIVFTDTGGRPIDPANVFHFKDKAIQPGENLAFRAEEIEMPEGAASYSVRFGDAH